VVRSYAKLLAYKDEYEVARLFTEAAFAAQLNGQFEGDFRLKFHLAPPLLASRDPVTGHLRKQEFGPWMLSLFRALAKLKGLRGTTFDPFGYTAERKQERALIREYEGLVDELLGGLTVLNHSLAVKLASIPDDIRGYGHVKDAHLAKAHRKQQDLLVQWRPVAAMPQAAE
jgi:indolepyruvate ferredoxin oxidoreductase